MSHFAEIDKNNIVLRVIVFDAPDGPEGEAAVTAWAGGGIWRQTSYNARIRGKYAGIGDLYDEATDVFIAPETDAVLDAQPTLIFGNFSK